MSRLIIKYNKSTAFNKYHAITGNLKKIKEGFGGWLMKNIKKNFPLLLLDKTKHFHNYYARHISLHLP